MKTAITNESLKGAPPVVVTALAWVADLTINNMVGIITIVYVGLQATYLLWKWRRESRE